MFSKVKPSSFAFGEILTSGQVNQLDENLSHAVDGLNGGLYTLEEELTFDGEAVNFESELVARAGIVIEAGGLAVQSGNVVIEEDLDVNDDLTAYGFTNLADTHRGY